MTHAARTPVRWEIVYFAKLGRRLTSVTDYDDGRRTVYVSVEDPLLKRALIDEAERERAQRQGALF